MGLKKLAPRRRTRGRTVKEPVAIEFEGGNTAAKSAPAAPIRKSVAPAVTDRLAPGEPAPFDDEAT